VWFRRDLRLADHPALLAAAADAENVLPLFVLDPALWRAAGAPRRAWLLRSLRSLDEAIDGRLAVVTGDPVSVVPWVAAESGAQDVHVSADTGPYGRRRDEAVAAALRDAGRRLTRTGTPYAIGPGTIRNGSGEPYRVFTPFSKAWVAHGWPAPARPAASISWAGGSVAKEWPDEPDLAGVDLPPAGEAAAHQRWQEFLAGPLADYRAGRERPAVAGTSALSAHLKYGEIHPRTLLADLGRREGPDVETYRAELCWREFYADVLWHRPETAWEYYRADFARMRYEEPGAAFEAWAQGRTGFPFVDAGMRQLRSEGWMHNRLRMVTASFLVKDLHIEWQHGARHFMRWLRDGDLASNNHGWQWAAGSGTDAAPYFRVFNPVTQGEKFDPTGEYVRRYVPELRHLTGKAAHAPWDAPDGYAHGYPQRIVDHLVERAEALGRLAEITR